jgi:hypothetical protein
MAKRTKPGAATDPSPAAPPRRRSPGPAGTRITTVRFAEDQWVWLRRQALERSVESGAKADASEIVRELVAAAMEKGSR